MNVRERDRRRTELRKRLTTALFMLDADLAVASVQVLLAAQQAAALVGKDALLRTIRGMTADEETPQ